MVGYLVFKECFGLRKQGRHRRAIVEEYPVGMELPVYHLTSDMDLFVEEGVVDVLDASRKPTTWEALFKDEDPRIGIGIGIDKPRQRPVTVQKVKASTRPVKLRKVKK